MQAVKHVRSVVSHFMRPRIPTSEARYPKKPIETYSELFKKKGPFWLMIPAFFWAHHVQYKNDVNCVAAVRYDVKLYPKKPVVSYRHL